MTATIGFNHLFIDKGPLTGPGYYAVQVVENILRLPVARLAPFGFKIFAQRGTEHHYSAAARDLIVEAPASSRFSRVAREQLLLPLQSRREKVDLLFSPGFVSPLFGARVKAATIHDMYYRVVPHVVERFQLQYWRAMIPVTSRVCDLILTVSESSRRDIERYLPAARGKVVVTPLASRFTPETGGDDRLATHAPPFVLMVANLTPNKNVTRVVEALAALRREGRCVDFVHIGADGRGELARAIAAHGMQGHARSLGKVDDATLAAAARDSLCMVVPSLYEGFGMPAIEAQALDAPLICSDRSALPEVAGDAALMFDPEDTRALAACIARVMDDPALRAEMRRKGLDNVRNFSWRRTAELTLDAFDRHLRRERVGAA